MATITTKGAPAPSTPSKPKDKPSALQPIALLDTPKAKAYSIARPLLLLGGCALRLPALIDDPVAALNSALPFVVVIQVAYAVVCLPVAGSTGVKSAKKPRPGERKKADSNAPSMIKQAILSLLLTALSSLGIHVLFILFGAPFLDHMAHTSLTAMHFATLALFPIFYTRGVEGQAMLSLAGAYAPMDEVSGGLLGAGVGAWLGAVPIPLDWDREWQKWPVTIVVGAYMGYTLGSRVLGALCFGRRLVEGGREKGE